MDKGIHQPLAMTEYVHNAMSKARYQILDDGTYYADIFLCPGVWATGETVEECREALKDELSEWLLSAYKGIDPLPAGTESAWLRLYLYRTRD